MKSGRTFLVLWDIRNINDTNTSCVPIFSQCKGFKHKEVQCTSIPCIPIFICFPQAPRTQISLHYLIFAPSTS